MMNTQTPWIDQAYRILETVTPLRWDCGRLCGSICCTSRAPGTGMILLPGEETRYQSDLDWAEIIDLDALPAQKTPQRYQGYGLHLLVCQGRCPRQERPLACRMFPLAPVLTHCGVVRLVLDTDGIEICPLVQAGNINALSRSFVRKVRSAWQVLLQESAIRRWVEAESRRRVEGNNDPWLRLFSSSP